MTYNRLEAVLDLPRVGNREQMSRDVGKLSAVFQPTKPSSAPMVTKIEEPSTNLAEVVSPETKIKDEANWFQGTLM